MARRLTPYGIKAHPMLTKIIDAMLEGKQSDRDIAKWCQPSLSHTAIHNYRKSIVEPSMRQADLLKSVLPINREETKEVTADFTLVEQPLQLARSALLAAPVLAVREKRIAALQDRVNRLQMIVDERAGHADYKDVPGGKSGLLSKKPTAYGDAYAVDSTLLSEFREHEKQVAIELGQWQEGNQLNVAVQIVMPGNGNPAPDWRDDDAGLIDITAG